jgi:hypothetical protein
MSTETIITNKYNGVNNYESQLLQNFYDYLSPKPYCTDTLGILAIRPKSVAAEKAYIQPNPIHRNYWFVFDLDYSHSFDFLSDSTKEKIPRANIEVENRKNRHCHLIYAIDPAVFTLQNARRKPLELAADVDRGLTALLTADPAYGKLICKNPLSYDIWNVYVYHPHKYTLRELLEYIPDKIHKQKRKPKEEIGLGRNCTIFEKIRHYAYSEYRRLKFCDYRLEENVYKHALDINADFIAPLGTREVKCIARSVSKWTSRHMDSAGFSEWCSVRGKVGNRKSQIVRTGKSLTRAEEIIAYKVTHPHESNYSIAKIFNCDERTVRRALPKI